MTVRTKPTVKAGISKDSRWTGGARFIQYEPGNGTRYDVLFTKMPGSRKHLYRDFIVASFLNHRKPSFLLPPWEGVLHWRYFSEKTGFGEADAKALTELVAHVAGIEAWLEGGILEKKEA